MNFNILNVLVVDDELPIRQEFELMPWQEYNCIHVGSAANGMEALEFCRSFCPDIVITDITMPVMDGIELIKQLQQEFPKVKVIILTCHKDFFYAKQALTLGVVDYLIKLDLSKEAICSVVQKARELIDIESLAHQTIKDTQRTRLSELFSRMLKQREHTEAETLEKELAALDFHLDLDQSCLLIIEFVTSQIFVENEIRSYLNRCDILNHWFFLNNGYYCLVFHQKTDEAILSLLGGLKEHLDANLFLSTAKVHPFAVRLSKGLSLSDYLTYIEHEPIYRAYHFYHYQEYLISCDTMPVFGAVTAELQKSFYALAKTDAQIFDFDELGDWALAARLYPNELKQLTTRWLQDSQALPQSTYVQKTWNTLHIDEFIDMLRQEIQLNDKNQLRYEIRMAMELVAKEYMNPISLSYVADKVHLSPQHLSKIFSKDVGGTFNDYITRIRIENAQRLINESNLKIYEIAEQVGIPNYRYFSTLYKKWTGNNPTSIKKKVF